MYAMNSCSFGSSPLARGTFTLQENTEAAKRLIPARAGNIRVRSTQDSPDSAHPRSRGEHFVGCCPISSLHGSSPLARGTFGDNLTQPYRVRLIPARAGNIRPSKTSTLRSPAHPRSRGEHGAVELTPWAGAGSSPLARGTCPEFHSPMLAFRLIPARAGNMHSSRHFIQRRTAHPRSRGEHTC